MNFCNQPVVQPVSTKIKMKLQFTFHNITNMKCHKKCCIYTSLGVFLVLSCVVVLAYFVKCEKLYEDRENLCGQINEPVCTICKDCVCASVCTPSDISLYCGNDCKDKGDDIDHWVCPHRYVGWTLIGVFLLIGGSAAIATVFYFLKEAFEEITGTQDDY